MIRRIDPSLEALVALVAAVEQNGGVRRVRKPAGVLANLVVPAAEPGFDLAVGEAYLLACKALGEQPKLIDSTEDVT